MLKLIEINNFKSLSKESLSLKPITILTGVNSSGKSSVIQALIFLQYFALQEQIKSSNSNFDELYKYREELSELIQSPNVVRNRNTNARDLVIKATSITDKINIASVNDIGLTKTVPIDVESDNLMNIHYLSANRGTLESLSKTTNLLKNRVHFLGNNTSLVLFENRSKKLDEEKCLADSNIRTLSYHLDYWLTEITKQKIQTNVLYNEPSESVSFSYNIENMSEIVPASVGTGQNHLVHILLVCLLAEKDDIVIIENPELHLHPKAQATLSVFFTMIASAGIQLILETHSEHIIHKFCHEVYKENLDNKDIILHYKRAVNENFESIYINPNGHYSDVQGEIVSFPQGFFDATLAEILEVS